jgi:hypothetical protein
VTGIAACYGRPDLAEVAGKPYAALVESRARCATCPVRRDCPPTPGYMTGGMVCVARERNGLQEPYTVTVERYALTHGLLPRQRRRRVQVAKDQLVLPGLRLPRARKAVAA